VTICLQVNKTSSGTTISLHCAVTSMNICIFPVLYFFTFLYYTDAGSTFFVLLMYYLSLQEHHTLASLAGVTSIVFRQTNVVWVIFVAGTTTIRTLRASVSKHLDEKSTGTLTEITHYIMAFVDHLFVMLKVLVMYGIVVVGFLVFVIVNRGVVVGDRSSHKPCLNFPQLFYFFAFSVAFSSPLLVDTVIPLLKFIKKTVSRPVLLLALISAILISLFLVNKLTYVHEYLLADNRHYPFYIWRKIYGRHWSVRYLVIPCYLCAGWSLWSKLAVNQSLTWQLIYWTCVNMVLVPQGLLEFRYFLIPYVLYRVHIPACSRFTLVVEFCLYCAINVVTIYMFLNKPFVRVHEPTQVQRFMW